MLKIGCTIVLSNCVILCKIYLTLFLAYWKKTTTVRTFYILLKSVFIINTYDI